MSFSTRVFVFQLHSFYSSKGGNRMTALGTSWQKTRSNRTHIPRALLLSGPLSAQRACTRAQFLLPRQAAAPSRAGGDTERSAPRSRKATVPTHGRAGRKTRVSQHRDSLIPLLVREQVSPRENILSCDGSACVQKSRFLLLSNSNIHSGRKTRDNLLSLWGRRGMTLVFATSLQQTSRGTESVDAGTRRANSSAENSF